MNLSKRGVINLSDYSVDEPSQKNINLSLESKYEIGTFFSDEPQSKKFFSETYISKDGTPFMGSFSLQQEKAWFQQSIYNTKSFSNMFEFANYVKDEVTCNHYMTTGVFRTDSERVIVTDAKGLKEKEGIVADGTKVISRTQNFIKGQNKPGIICIDIDMFKDKHLSLRETLDKLLTGIPEFKDAPMVIFPSTGSNIYGKSGQDWVDKDGSEISKDDFGTCQLRGVHGFHIFIGVVSTNWLTSALFERINKRMWLEGGGFIKISANGNLLERCLIDTSVLKPIQPIYTHANIEDPRIFQKLGEPWIVNPNSRPFNLRSISSLTPDEEVRYLSLIEEDKELLQETADRIRKDWAIKQAERTIVAQKAGEKGSSAFKMSVKNLTEEYMKTAVDRVLAGQQELFITPLIRAETGKLLTTDVQKDIHGTDFIVRTIDQILENPDLYHGARCACIEDLYYAPGGKQSSLIDYTRSRIYIKHEPFPRVFDFAHGGVSYRLLRDKVTIDLVADNFDGIIDDTLMELKKRNAIFKKGTVPYKLLMNEHGHLHLVQIKNRNLKYILAQNFSFFEFSQKNERYEAWPDGKFVDPLLAEFCIRNEGNTRGVTTIPYMDISGKLRVKKGYDPSTGFIYDEHNEGTLFRDLEKKTHFSIEDMQDALKIAESPIRLFKFKDPISSANMLAAMMTTVLKQWFNNDKTEMYPGFTTDGPGFGLGKTKLLQILGVLIKGRVPSSSTIEGDAGEIKKEIGSKFLMGNDFFFFDNIDKRLNSATLASLLTSKSVAFRVLGESKEAEFENSCFITASGKNISMSSELIRRFMNIRIEPVEVNYLNHDFDFEPVELALENRYKILNALMTLFMGYKYLTNPRMINKWEEIYGSKCEWGDFESKIKTLGSFETWSKEVGGCVKFIGEFVAKRNKRIMGHDECGVEVREPKYGMPGGDINDIFKEEAEGDMISFRGFMKIICEHFKDELLKPYEDRTDKNGKPIGIRDGHEVRFKWADIQDELEGESCLKGWFVLKSIKNGRGFSMKTRGFLGNIYEFRVDDERTINVRFHSNNNKKKIYYLAIEE